MDVIGGASTGSGTGGVVTVTGGAGSAATGVGGALVMAGGLGNTTGAGGAVSLTGGGGGNDAVGGTASLIGGAAGGGNRAGGAVIITGGLGTGTGAGGALTLTGGAGGSGGATGKGGAVNLVGGAASSTNDDGGSIVMTPGAKAGTGIVGGIFQRGFVSRNITVPAMTDTATLSTPNILQGTIKCTPTAAATYTMPTGATLAAALPTEFTTGDSLDFALVNIATNDTFDITVATAASGTTMYGNLVVEANSATTKISSGIFRIVCSGAATYDVYRVS